jgi:hypothetical protein
MGTMDSWLIWNLTAEKNHATDLHKRFPNIAIQHQHFELG